ncbi:hypothetical protein RCL1_001655 [Eukaryota sp. TZLM3-RCL]
MLQTVTFATQEYNAEALELLQKIRLLSPKRRYYPAHLENMEVVDFHPRLDVPRQCCGAYDVLVTSLIAIYQAKSSVTLDFLRLRGFLDSQRLYAKLSPFFRTFTVSLLIGLPSDVDINLFWEKVRNFVWDDVNFNDLFCPFISLINNCSCETDYFLALKFLKYVLWNLSDKAKSFAVTLYSTLQCFFPSNINLELPPLTTPSLNVLSNNFPPSLSNNVQQNNDNLAVEDFKQFKQELLHLRSCIEKFVLKDSYFETFLQVTSTSVELTIPFNLLNSEQDHPWFASLSSNTAS